MRVVVTGATGNVGTSVLSSLVDEPSVDSIVGLARRLPRGLTPPKVVWRAADVTRDDLVPHLQGADAVIHLAWAIQPSRDDALLRATNVDGSRRVFEAVAEAGVPALVYASSVGAYGPADAADEPVGEDWPTAGIETSFYSRHKAEVETELDRFEAANPAVRVVRLRPGLIFKGSAAAEIRRLFAGPFVPGFLLEPGRLPVFPWIAGLRAQAVHSHDIGEAYRLATIGEASGAFNIAAEPVLEAASVGEALGARVLSLPGALVRGAASATWHARLQPTPPGWVDMAIGSPLMDCSRARKELGWEPRRSAGEALRELLAGIAKGSGAPTPPLRTHAGGPLRIGEILTGIGRRD